MTGTAHHSDSSGHPPSDDHRFQPATDIPGQTSMTPEDFHRVRASEEFQMLRSTFRGFAFPMTIAFLVWYFAYVLCSTFARDLMSTTVAGMNFLNIGLLAGLGQFITTFLITWLYVRHANSKLDPIATTLRDQLEGNTR